MVIEVTDTSGNSYIIEDENDVGYYPYGANDPESPITDLPTMAAKVVRHSMIATTELYRKILGDLGRTCINFNTYTSSPSIGNLYGMSASDEYPEEFGFRISEGTVPEPISVNWYPEFSWGWDDPIMGRTGISPHITNPETGMTLLSVKHAQV